MKYLSLRKSAISALLASSVLVISGCNLGWDEVDTGGDGETGDKGEYFLFTGPGSKWNLQLERSGDKTFTLTERTNPGAVATLTLNGTYEEHSNDFIELVVDGTPANNVRSSLTLVKSGEDAAFLLPVKEGSDQIIAMIEADDCPDASDVNAVWLRYKHPTNNPTNDPLDFGEMNWSTNDEEIGLTKRYSLGAPLTTEPKITIKSGKCNDGYAADNTSEGLHYLSASNTASMDLYRNSSSQQQFLFALPQSSIAAFSDFDGDYIGVLYDGSRTAGSRTYPIKASCSTGGDSGIGGCNLDEISDIDSGLVNSSNSDIRIEFTGEVDQPVDGFIQSTIKFGDSGTETLVCMRSVPDKRIVACVGNSPTDNAKRINIFMASGG